MPMTVLYTVDVKQPLRRLLQTSVLLSILGLRKETGINHLWLFLQSALMLRSQSMPAAVTKVRLKSLFSSVM